MSNSLFISEGAASSSVRITGSFNIVGTYIFIHMFLKTVYQGYKQNYNCSNYDEIKYFNEAYLLFDAGTMQRTINHEKKGIVLIIKFLLSS